PLVWLASELAASLHEWLTPARPPAPPRPAPRATGRIASHPAGPIFSGPDEQALPLRLREPTLPTREALDILTRIISRSAQEPSRLEDRPRIALIGSALAAAFRREDREDIMVFLREMLEARPQEVLPAAERLIRSYLAVAETTRYLPVATVCPLLKGEPPAAVKERVRRAISQLRDLYGWNPTCRWTLTLVTDDFSGPVSIYGETRKLLIEEYPDLFTGGQVRLFELPQEAFLPMRRIRDAAAAFGLRQALHAGGEQVVLTTLDGAIDLRQEGLILDAISKDQKTVAVGSRELLGSPRPTALGTLANQFPGFFSRWVALRALQDAQCRFTAFHRDLLWQVLPVSSYNEFDRTSLTAITLEPFLVARAQQLGWSLQPLPIAWAGSARSPAPPSVRRAADLIHQQKRQLGVWTPWPLPTLDPILPVPSVLLGSQWFLDFVEQEKGEEKIPLTEKIRLVLEMWDLGTTDPQHIAVSRLPEEELRLPGGPYPLKKRGGPIKLTVLEGNKKGTEVVLKWIGWTIEEARWRIDVSRRWSASARLANLPAADLWPCRGQPEDRVSSYLGRIGGAYCTLETFVHGNTIHPSKTSPRHWEDAGRLLSQIHQGLGTEIPEGQSTQWPITDIVYARDDLVEYQRRVQQLKDENPSQLTQADALFLGMVDRILKQFDLLEQRLKPQRLAQTRQGVLHRDLSFFNILFTPTGATAIDFERSQFGSLLHDFRSLLLTRDWGRTRGFVWEHVVDTVAAYQQGPNPLSDADLKVLPEILRATLLWDLISRFFLRRDQINDQASPRSRMAVLSAYRALLRFERAFPERGSLERFVEAVRRRARGEEPRAVPGVVKKALRFRLLKAAHPELMIDPAVTANVLTPFLQVVLSSAEQAGQDGEGVREALQDAVSLRPDSPYVTFWEALAAAHAGLRLGGQPLLAEAWERFVSAWTQHVVDNPHEAARADYASALQLQLIEEVAAARTQSHVWGTLEEGSGAIVLAKVGEPVTLQTIWWGPPVKGLQAELWSNLTGTWEVVADVPVDERARRCQVTVRPERAGWFKYTFRYRRPSGETYWADLPYGNGVLDVVEHAPRRYQPRTIVQVSYEDPLHPAGPAEQRISALLKELPRLGYRSVLIMPWHHAPMYPLRETGLTVDAGGLQFDVLMTRLHGSEIYAVRHPEHSTESAGWRPRPLLEEVALFSLATVELLRVLRSRSELPTDPDVVHCHGWPTGFVPLLLKTTARETFPLTATIFSETSSASLAQGAGQFEAERFNQLVAWGIPEEADEVGGGFGHHDGLNLPKGGFIFSDVAAT
ncbi:MAG TPA: hypothetical protein DDX89_00805, partial [Candidatus Omnitrophica bacterium]|nr:hypothetical protein [Candidatus Omnitrophota bacterium]